MVCKALDQDDARALVRAARTRGDRKGLAVLLGLYQGLRRAEIAALPWSAIGDDGWVTVVGKGSKTRVIPLHPVVLAALEAVPREGEYLFPGRFGGHVAGATVWDWAGEVAVDAGVTTKLHWLRHTALATQNDATGDLRTVQHFAGHSKPQTTAGYTRASRRRLQDAVLAIDY